MFKFCFSSCAWLLLTDASWIFVFCSGQFVAFTDTCVCLCSLSSRVFDAFLTIMWERTESCRTERYSSVRPSEMPQLFATDQIPLKSSCFRNSYLVITIQNNFRKVGLPALERVTNFTGEIFETLLFGTETPVIAQSVWQVGLGLGGRGWCFDSLQCHETCLFRESCRPALGHTQPLIRRVSRVVSPRIQRPERENIHFSVSGEMLRINRVLFT